MKTYSNISQIIAFTEHMAPHVTSSETFGKGGDWLPQDRTLRWLVESKWHRYCRRHCLSTNQRAVFSWVSQSQTWENGSPRWSGTKNFWPSCVTVPKGGAGYSHWGTLPIAVNGRLSCAHVDARPGGGPTFSALIRSSSAALEWKLFERTEKYVHRVISLSAES